GIVAVGAFVISAIALLASGVGVMNIMLVSVTERTREIGIRRAIGAKKRNIMTQFVLEAVVLSEIGGLLGVVLGIAMGNVVPILLKVPAVLPWDWALIGLGVCSLVGVVFGTYPAWKVRTSIRSNRFDTSRTGRGMAGLAGPEPGGCCSALQHWVRSTHWGRGM
ncbi:MAG: ABC transporter permease, partial [Verrucomicrobiota bacterium]